VKAKGSLWISSVIFVNAALAFALGLAATPSANAAPIIEKSERMEINWSTMRLRFYGEAKAGGGSDLRAVEKQAWTDGLAYVNDAVRDLNIAANDNANANPERLTAEAKKAATQVSTSTSSYNTTYYGDGTVRVFLENGLPKAFVTSGIRFRQKESPAASMIQYTGVVIKAAKAIRPRPTYQVVDEAGGILFDVSDMAEEAFHRNLMGRWFKNPAESEVVGAVGSNPIYLEADVGSDGRLIINKATWDEKTAGHRALLVSGSIALAVP
jgi:hypothetical protein